MRDIDRSELLFDSRDVTAIALDTDPIDARIMTNGEVVPTRADIVANLNNLPGLINSADIGDLDLVSLLGAWDTGSVLDMLHDVHLNMETLAHLADPALLTSTVTCANCHAPDSSIKATGTVGTAGIINDDNTFEATVSNYILAGGVLGDEYVTCATACHHDGSQDGTVTAEEQGTYVVARLTATNSRTDNRVITLDASESACVNGCNFSGIFTVSGCSSASQGGNGADVEVILAADDVTPCVVSTTVTDSVEGDPTVVSVTITANDDVVPYDLLNNLGADLADADSLDAYGNCVPGYGATITSGVLDPDIDWASNVYIYWGDRTRTVTTVNDINNDSVTHVYDSNGTKTIRIRTKDANWNITDEFVSAAFGAGDGGCTP
jgi:hypothetical protein